MSLWNGGVFISVFYTNEVRSDGLVYSCDNIYLKVKFQHNTLQKFMEWLSRMDVAFLTLGLTDMQYYECKTRRNGSYVHWFTFNLQSGASFSFGASLVTPSVNTMNYGVVDFNPNKVGEDYVFKKFMERLTEFTYRRVIDRWDLAIDIPVERSLVRLIKDRRDYSTYDSGGGNFTEYLGQRNKCMRVKLYNKSAESGLDVPLTRLEITCDRNIGAAPDGQVLFNMGYMPSVLCASYQTSLDFVLDEKLNSTDKVILTLVNETGRYDLLRSLGRSKYEKLKPYLLGKDRTLTINYSCVVQVRRLVGVYENYNII